MKVFKFGGASVKNADAIKNVAKILKQFGKPPLLIVISAMGKTTNALEEVLNAYWNGKDYQPVIQQLRQSHFDIMKELFADENEADIFDEIDNIFLSLELYFEKDLEHNYDLIYDQVVSLGEVLSTKIVSNYLSFTGYKNKWVDARNFVITNDLFREARIDWETTSSLINRKIPQMLANAPVITQGFLGSTRDNLTTTLGREGSDFTASIFAHCLDADEVVIWKDVPGIMNADPNKFNKTVLFDQLSYSEAVEMTYYGATVLHPKTIKPIQNKNIPLNVRSFIKPAEKGTLITNDASIQTDIPIIILKEKQLVLSLSTKDFSFIAEDSIKQIFDEVVKQGMKVNLMQNSAICFQICIDDREQKVRNFMNALSEKFNIQETSGLNLLTISHYNNKLVKELTNNKKVVLEQKSGDTIQLVIKPVV